MINHGDYGYAKLQFDKQSIKNLGEDLYKIKDDLARSQIWS